MYISRLKMGEYLANKIIKNININDIDLIIPVLIQVNLLH